MHVVLGREVCSAALDILQADPNSPAHPPDGNDSPESFLRITFILPGSDLSGGARVVATYAENLAAKGHKVTIVSLPARRPSFRARMRELVKRGVWLTTERRSSHFDQLKNVAHHVLPTYRPIRADDVPDGDAIVATWWETAEWMSSYPSAKGRQFHLVQDYEVFPYLPLDRVKAVYRLPLTRIAVSKWIAEQLRLEGDNRVITIANAVDQLLFTSPPRRKQERFTVGFLYSETSRKNSGLALEIVSEAAKRFPGLCVRAFGSTPLPEGTVSTAADITYRLKPRQAEIPTIYASCDAWLFTSTSEGFGLPILEAMACRTPVVATRAGAAPDIINGRNGFLAEATVEEFLERLSWIARMSDDEWRACSDAAYETAISYTWDDATRLLEESLADGHEQRAPLDVR